MITIAIPPPRARLEFDSLLGELHLELSAQSNIDANARLVDSRAMRPIRCIKDIAYAERKIECFI